MPYKTLKIVLLLLTTLFSCFSQAKDDHFLSDFIVGKYLLIGKAIDSEATYHGRVAIYYEGDKLKVKRVINDQTTIASAAIETTLNGDSRVLRIRFEQQGIHYEETCLFRSDLDNYARISCYLYQPGTHTKTPGLEALFNDHTVE